MSDHISDAKILEQVALGKFFSDGAKLENPKLDAFLKKMHEVEIGLHLPQIETIDQGPGVHVFDNRDISEEKVTDLISKTWGETPDTLTSHYMAVLPQDNGRKMLITQFFDSVNIPEGLKKVSYQFARKGNYPDGEFEQTEIVRFEYSELDPYKYLGGNVLETVGGPGTDPRETTDKQNVKKDTEVKLEDNQFLDTETGWIVTWYKIPVE